MRHHTALQRLTKLREQRPTRSRLRPVAGDGGLLAALVSDLKRADSMHGRVERALAAALPSGLAEQCRLGRVASLRVTLVVRSSAARYRLDRWLRSGGERSLRDAVGQPVRCRVVVGH